MKDDASESVMWYDCSAKELKTFCKYSNPFSRTDGFVSKNLRVIHFKIKSKLAFWASRLTLKS